MIDLALTNNIYTESKIEEAIHKDKNREIVKEKDRDIVQKINHSKK